MKKTLKQLEQLLKENAGKTSHLPSIKPTFKIDVANTGSFFIDLKTNRVTPDSDADPDCTIGIPTMAMLEEMIADPRKAWALGGNGTISSTEKFSALILAESLFPGALEQSLTAHQYRALFPHLLPNAYTGIRTEVFFGSIVPQMLRDNPKLLSTVTAAYQFDIEGAGTWTIDMTSSPGRVYGAAARTKGSVISTDRATFEEVLNDESKLWMLFNSGRATVTNACRASQVVNALWPGAFAKGMPAPLYASLFPNELGEPSDSEYNRTTGNYTTYVQGKDANGTKVLVPINYSQLGEWAIYEGDIILGKMEEMTHIKNTVDAAPEAFKYAPEGIRIIDWSDPTKFVWPNAVVYYTIDSSVKKSANKHLVDAINHWTSKTRITFVQRTNQANYVKVIGGSGCSSAVGMQGKEQTVMLSPNCSVGAAIHEIGHVIGLFHEQTRHDRDQYVTIMWDQIIEEYKPNFQIPPDIYSEDIIAYDYDSIMHYGAYAFAKGSLPTIVPTQQGVTIGQDTGLSKLDLEAVVSIYGPKAVVAERVEEAVSM